MDMGAFWDALGVRERGLLVKSGRRRSFRRGDRLCREGDRSTTVLVLLTGHVRILTLAPDGREVVVGVRGAGDVVGDIAAVDHRPRSATVEALDELQVLEFSGSRFFMLCQQESRIACAMLVVLAGRLRALGRQWLDLSSGTAQRRVAALLLQLAVQYGVRHGDDIEIVTPATQAGLAMTAAISRESWARVTRDLRQRGVISTGRRRVTVHRPGELRRLAQ